MIKPIHNYFHGEGSLGVVLFSGEEICKNCKGKGGKLSTHGNYVIMCKKCKGTGKIDWIKKAIGS